MPRDGRGSLWLFDCDSPVDSHADVAITIAHWASYIVLFTRLQRQIAAKPAGYFTHSAPGTAGRMHPGSEALITELLIASGIMGAMGVLLAAMLAYADKKLYVYED